MRRAGYSDAIQPFRFIYFALSNVDAHAAVRMLLDKQLVNKRLTALGRQLQRAREDRHFRGTVGDSSRQLTGVDATATQRRWVEFAGDVPTKTRLPRKTR